MKMCIWFKNFDSTIFDGVTAHADIDFVSPYIIIVHIIFSVPLGSLGSFIVFLKIQFCLSRC